MKKKDKEDIANTVKALKFIADNDPQALVIANSNINILKARCELERQEALSAEEETG